MVKMRLVEAIDSLVPLDEHLAAFRGTDIQKESQKRPNQARDGKDKVISKPKSVKVRKSTPTKSKVNQMKKIQLEGLKLPNLKLYYKKTRAEIEFCYE
ncbi:hypothetical protein Tco_1535581, partial [Tanacetum coccineum]